MFKFLTEGENRFRNLRIFNVVMGFFHLAQGIAMIALSNDTRATLTTSFLQTSSDGENFNAVSQTENFIDVQLGPAVAVFLLLSAAAHFLIASPMFFNWYKENLAKNANYARWYEYALSSSWMIAIIAVLSGVYDAPSLVLIFGLNAMMILFGYMMELHNQSTGKTDWTSFIFGCVAGIIPWIVIFWYFYAAITGFEGPNPVPDFVYGIIISLFVVFNVFAINMYLQYKQIGPWKNYLFGEAMYIILSLVAKSMLAWQVWSGTLRGD